MKYFFNFYLLFALLIIYAVACALGTFVENDFGVWDAKILIYDTAFFNALHALIFVLLLGLIIRFRMWKKPASFAFHSAILLIIVGAGITRFWGLESSLHIQNEQLSSTAISQNQNIIVISDKNGSIEQTFFPIFISPLNDYTQLFEQYMPSFVAKFLGLFGGEITKGFVPQRIVLNNDEFIVKFDEFKPAMPPVSHFPMIQLSVSNENESISNVLAQNFFDETLSEFKFKDNEILISWGARFIKLPFAVFLQEIKMQHYPGSTNPSNFSVSALILEKGTSEEVQISMSKPADFKGHRIFLSSFDEDSQGALFTINKDPGKFLTYAGYALLFAGLIFSLFAKNGRFLSLCKRLSFVFIFALFAVPLKADEFEVISKLNTNEFKTHAANFAKIPVLSYEGRVKPFKALTLDIINKISHKSSMLGLSHNELVLGAMLYYDEFLRLPLIRVKTPELRSFIGTDKEYIAVEEVYKDGNYKLAAELKIAQSKAEKTPYEKDIVSVDEAVNLLIATTRAELLRIIPSEDGTSWLSPSEAMQNLPANLANETQILFEDYFNALFEAVENKDFGKANSALSELKDFQAKRGEHLMPSEFKLWAENALLDFNAFENLGRFYLAFGILLLFALLFCLSFKQEVNERFKFSTRAIFMASFVLFLLAFAMRWFIGTHAPWSNAYESMLLIALVLGIFGIVLGRNPLFLALCAFGVGIVLWVANLGFMDPQITPLMPVLQSHWLNIHVSTITASYAFFVMAYLASLAGFVSLILRTQNGENLAILCEIMLILGTSLLAIGTFLGGIWANESWGRYWGWDPKETWSLILLVVFVMVLHARFIKGLNSPFVLFCGACVGFFVMLMTYFGVNYFLSGKHSYATGEGSSVPLSVFVLLILNLLLALTAWARNKFKPFVKN